jgi:hypothetical protein
MIRTPQRWQESIDLAMCLLNEAGVVVDTYSGVIGDCLAILDGHEWNP